MSEESTTQRANRRRTLLGVVTAAKLSKTRRVEVVRLSKHPKYGKFLRKRLVCHAHDETNASGEGDEVEIQECRPHSKTKRWRVVRVVTKGKALIESKRKAAPAPEEPATPAATSQGTEA